MREKIYHEYPCGHIYKSLPMCVLRGNGCDICNRVLMGLKRRMTDEDFKAKCKEVNPTIKINSIYISSSDHIECECLNCGNIWFPVSHSIVSGYGCPICALKIISEKNTYTHSEFLCNLNKKGIDYSNIIFMTEYSGCHSQIHCKCKLCGNEWYTVASALLVGENCPNCKISQGEKRIKKFLDDNKIKYTPQKKFDGLVGIGGRLLSYDFYLYDYNILIEYQGIQHFKSIDHFGGEDQFNVQQEHDKCKREYANNRNIKLIEVSYIDYNIIEQILTEYLNLESVTTVEVA